MLNKLEKSAIMLKLEENLTACYESAINAGAKLRLCSEWSGSHFEVVGGCNDDALMNKVYLEIAYFDGSFAVYSCLVSCRKSDIVSDFCKRHGYSFEGGC